MIATSAAASSAKQIMAARPAVIAIELVPSLAHDTLRLLSQITVTSHIRHVPLLVYGAPATDADRDAIARLGGRWIDVLAGDRAELVAEVNRALFTEMNTSSE